MDKMQFENGTLVSPAKVVIDGVEHEVIPAVYEGKTPFSAANINKMQDNVEKGMCAAVYNGGEIDPNTTLENWVLTKHTNNPAGNGNEFYYIKTIFYTSISTDNNRSQIAYGYKTNKIYYRYYYSGSWSEWVPVLHDTGWQTPTLLNNWQNYGESFARAAYKKSGNRVTLKGLVKSGVAETVMFNLPEGYRPTEIKMFICLSNNQTVSEIRIRVSGDVEVKYFGSSWISLDNISFLVD